jgi:hypothetical protein
VGLEEIARGNCMTGVPLHEIGSNPDAIYKQPGRMSI